jgi:hypothetical protein
VPEDWTWVKNNKN